MKIFFARIFAIALVLVLTSTGLWAGGADEEGSAAAADKKYVTDPTTGKVVTAPEYGGIITYSQGYNPPSPDVYIHHDAAEALGVVVERLAIADWALDRDVFKYRTQAFAAPVWRGHLAESWEPDDTTIILHIRQGVNWHDKR